MSPRSRRSASRSDRFPLTQYSVCTPVPMATSGPPNARRTDDTRAASSNIADTSRPTHGSHSRRSGDSRMSEKTLPSSPPNIMIVRGVKSGLLRRGASVGDVRANEFLVENHEFRPSPIERRLTAYLRGSHIQGYHDSRGSRIGGRTRMSGGESETNAFGVEEASARLLASSYGTPGESSTTTAVPQRKSSSNIDTSTVTHSNVVNSAPIRQPTNCHGDTKALTNNGAPETSKPPIGRAHYCAKCS